METIHLKSVDPLSQELLRSASHRGIKLNWERYERQQPQDGFSRLGLTCPVGCMQGPCRIDPFRRGAERGICGLDGDGMVAALLLRLVQQGLLEASAGRNGYLAGEVTWPAALSSLAASAIKTLGGQPLFLSEIQDAAALLLRPAASPERLLTKAVRLGLMAVALRAEVAASPLSEKCLSLQVGYGLLAGDKINIGVAGNPPHELIAALKEKTGAAAAMPVQAVSLGDWTPDGGGNYLPLVCTSGEAELAVSSGNISLILAGPDADPSLSELCRTLALPFLQAGDAVEGVDQIISAAVAHARWSATQIDPALVAAAGIFSPGKPFPGIKTTKKVALIGGCDDLRHSLGYLPVELAFALRGQEFIVGAWGDAALWMVKNGFAAPDQENPVLILDHAGGPLAVMAALAAAGRLGELGGICLTGLKSSADLAFALGLSALGANVCLATPLPIWGSEPVRCLLAKILAGLGGGLTHFDHPAGLPEILSWFTGK